MERVVRTPDFARKHTLKVSNRKTYGDFGRRKHNNL